MIFKNGKIQIQSEHMFTILLNSLINKGDLGWPQLAKGLKQAVSGQRLKSGCSS